MTQIRYALYFVPPPDSALAALGRAWLAYDTETGQAVTPTLHDGIDPGFLAEITSEPRRYGFHATLKPPFLLAEGVSEAELVAAVERLAAVTRPAHGPPLMVSAVGGFLALLPTGPADELALLAAACVRGLDRFRRPPAAEELARRRAVRLSQRQELLLARWGYPYVLEEFRFHLTLTRRLAPDERAIVEPTLTALAADAGKPPLEIADIALCRAVAGGGFSVRARFPLGIA